MRTAIIDSGACRAILKKFMTIFSENSAIKLVLKNKNQYVRLAAQDLLRDIKAVSAKEVETEICD